MTEISERTFFNCTRLRDVELHEGIQKIEEDAFSRCQSLERISIPFTVTEISHAAFYKCSSLKEVVLNKGLEKIGKGAFDSCTSLESITIPSTVTEIDSDTFKDCQGLRVVELHEGIQKIAWNAFEECVTLERFKFPDLSTRLDTITRAGQREVEDRIDDIRRSVERRGSELFIPERGFVVQGSNWVGKKRILGRIDRLITYYELKEATTLLELAMWKSKINQESTNPINRDVYRIDIPGPVKHTILQYLNFRISGDSFLVG